MKEQFLARGGDPVGWEMAVRIEDEGHLGLAFWESQYPQMRWRSSVPFLSDDPGTWPVATRILPARRTAVVVGVVAGDVTSVVLTSSTGDREVKLVQTEVPEAPQVFVEINDGVDQLTYTHQSGSKTFRRLPRRPGGGAAGRVDPLPGSPGGPQRGRLYPRREPERPRRNGE
jgi:hypothetical protein